MKVLVARLCLTLCDPMDCSPAGSSVCGILQARILEWIAISYSRGSSRPRNWTCISCIAGRLLTAWTTREVLVACKGWHGMGPYLSFCVSIVTCFRFQLHCVYRYQNLFLLPFFLKNPQSLVVENSHHLYAHWIHRSEIWKGHNANVDMFFSAPLCWMS